MNPISGYRPSYVPLDETPAPAEQAAVSLCKASPATVARGFLCDEPATTSNACRAPSNPVDAFVCDDRKMAEAQASVWGATVDVLKTMFTAPRREGQMKPEDRRWLWLVYVLALVPYGGFVVVLGSSALYYRWRREHPAAAKRLNVHAWLAMALRVAVYVTWRRWHG